MPEVYGNVTGLAPRALRTLERIYRRRVPLDKIATPELVRSLAEASREVKRQVGALVHRSGQVDTVIVGDATGLMLPDIGRLRAAEGRFRALRLVHTHLYNEPLTHDDLVDLTRLRLDLVCAVLLTREGEPRSLTWAYNVPTHPERTAGSQGSGAPRNYEVVGPVPYGTEQPHFGELIQALEAEFARQQKTRQVRAKDGSAILVHVGDKRQSGAMRRAEAQLAELESLARTAGVQVVERVIQLRERPDPKLLLGRGKLEQVVMRAIDLDAETLIFDCDLTPAQASSIAQHTDLKVIDRSQLILDIFAQRAESVDGKLQVELAQLKYTLPRLGTRDDALSRLTGGIGGRGPGETKLEIDRRRIRDRIRFLEKKIDAISSSRAVRRRERERRGLPVISIVGYTNAGKSTLLNALTQSSVLAEDKLFATLDPTSRRLRFPRDREVIITDTVGFIRDLPPDLMAAFRATLEELESADLLLHVVDVTDPAREAQIAAVERILDDLGLSKTPRILVFNKADRLPPGHGDGGARLHDAVLVSATERTGFEELLRRADRILWAEGASSRPDALSATSA